MLGITVGRAPKFSKNYLEKIPPGPPFTKGGEHSVVGVAAAIQLFIDEVKTLAFPAQQHEIA